MTRPREDLSIVLPVYNEAATIETVLREIHAKVASQVPNVEFIVAEDGSTDATPEILARLAPELGIRLVTGRERKGYARAVKDALGLATHAWIFFSDSDGQQEPDDFFGLAETAEASDADIVTGVKTPRRDPWPRLVMTRALRLANRLILGVHFRDANCGFRLMRRSVVTELLPRLNTLPLLVSTELLVRASAAGYRVVEMPVRHYARTDGVSRGLPPAWRLPLEAARLLRSLVALRGEIAAGRAVEQPQRP